MNKFVAFANLGMNAALQAAKSRKEVDEVFSEVNSGLATLGDVRLVVMEFFEMGGFGPTVQALMNPKQYSALAIQSTSNKSFKPIQVARWKQPLEGYPCWVISDGAEVSCEDRASLEAEMGRLLSSAKVGEALSAAIAASSAGSQQQGPSALPA